MGWRSWPDMSLLLLLHMIYLTARLHTYTVKNLCIQTFCSAQSVLYRFLMIALQNFVYYFVASYRKSGQLTHRGNRGGPCCLRSRYPDVQFVWMQTVSCQSFARNRICCRLDRVGSTHPAFRAAFPSLHRLFPIRFHSLFFHLEVDSSHAVTYYRPKRIMTRIGEFS